MCGILGLVSQSMDDVTLSTFSDSLKFLTSRWPDHQEIFRGGSVLLGHTRLSIIDTSSSANQPFELQGRIIIFNGEIYNFQSIRSELEGLGYIFSTTSDTEVLLASYIEWWESCVERLDGMWAFCIYDPIKNKLFLSRDRIGEKPLLYSESEDGFVFWSELPALISLIGKERIYPDNWALANFDLYNFRHIPSPHTAFVGISKLEPGYNLVYDLETWVLTKNKYFRIAPMRIEDDATEQFDRLFRSAVAQTCFADVPVGIFLSGGIDSSLIASVMQDRDIRTYSLGYDEADPEIIRADAIAKHLWLENKKIFFKEYLATVDILEVLERVVCHYGEPVNLMQIIYADIILKEMKKDGIKVAVGGNGADELFYGYDGMNFLRRLSDIKKSLDRIPGFSSLIPSIRLKEWLYRYTLSKNPVIRPEYKKFLYAGQLSEYASELPSQDLIDVFSWLWLRIENEHSITIINDVVGSINGMEVRTPFLNRDIIDFACNLPVSQKIVSYTDKTHNKFILKKALEKYLPKELIYNKKMGFWYGIDLFDAILQHPRAQEYLIQEASRLGLYNTRVIEALYRSYVAWEKVDRRCLVSIVINVIWFKSFIG